MKKIEIDCSLTLWDNSCNILIQADQDTVGSLCIGLMLLQDGLEDELIITNIKNDLQLIFTFRKLKHKKQSNYLIAQCSRSKVSFVLDSNSLGYIKQFLLIYYKDGVADVDHIDIEFANESAGEKSINLTISVPNAKPPMTIDEFNNTF